MPVNPVGARSVRVQGPRGKRALRFPQDRQDSPAAFLLRFGGREMIDVTIPPQYRARVKQRLKVLKYVEDHGVRPAARHFALSRVTVRAWRDRYRMDGIVGLLPRYPKRRWRPSEARDHPTGETGAGSKSVLARIARASGSSAFTAFPSPLRRFSGCFATSDCVNYRADARGDRSKCACLRRNTLAIPSRWT